MKKLVSVVALAAAGIAAPALAQDASGVELYAGVIAGYDSVRVEALGDAGSQDGVVYGGVVGAQINREGLVLGIEGEVTGATTKEEAEDVFTGGDVAELRAGRDIFAGVRIGGYLSPGLMVYGKGGYTNARATLEYDDGVDAFEESDNLEGYRLAAGVEFGEGRLRWRGEYRYSNYGSYEIDGFDTGISAERHQVVVGAIFAF